MDKLMNRVDGFVSVPKETCRTKRQMLTCLKKIAVRVIFVVVTPTFSKDNF